MTISPLVWPMLAMVALVFAVAGRMFATRVGEMTRRRIHPQAVASAKQMAETLEDTRAADHFRNLFETPVLFFVGVLAVMQAGIEGVGLLLAAWAFVGARVLMAIEACGRNKVMRRFQCFLAACAALLAFWLQLALHWAGVL
ncbi:MAG: MAPEG family protein [Xanthomonadaceae bacterium]|jgi:hypothetical protein|nr:MAPEG family protein [Xanthomonadaceae bacterium]